MAKKKQEPPKPEETPNDVPAESPAASSSQESDYEQHPKFDKFKKPQGEN